MWKPSVKKALVIAIASVLWAILAIHALADNDLLQQAMNYVFTGTINPQERPEIVDRKSCIVAVPDSRFPRFIRYYFDRFKPEDTRITKKYSGARTLYELDVASDTVVIEYLGADKTTVVQAYKSAQISLPGNIEQTQKALQIIAGHCKADQQKSPF
jgi:hypothetical protein